MTGLEGKTIIATCDTKKANKLGSLLEKHGAHMVEFPLIKTQASDNLPQKTSALTEDLEKYDWIVFTSSNGVTYFFEWLKSIQIQPANYNWKYAVIGIATGETLKQEGIKADLISKGKEASEFAKELMQELGTTNKNILISLGNLAPNTLEKTIGANHNCKKIITYKTINVDYSESEILNLMKNQENKIVLFMSPSAVESFYALQNKGLNIAQFETAVIGTVTQKALLAKGVTPDFIPSHPNLEILVNELAQHIEEKQIKHNN